MEIQKIHTQNQITFNNHCRDIEETINSVIIKNKIPYWDVNIFSIVKTFINMPYRSQLHFELAENKRLDRYLPTRLRRSPDDYNQQTFESGSDSEQESL